MDDMPKIIPEIMEYDEAMIFFANGEILCGAYYHMEQVIKLWAFCPKISDDLPNIKEVAEVVDHEMMHHILTNEDGMWASHCWDNICYTLGIDINNGENNI